MRRRGRPRRGRRGPRPLRTSCRSRRRGRAGRRPSADARRRSAAAATAERSISRAASCSPRQPRRQPCISGAIGLGESQRVTTPPLPPAIARRVGSSIRCPPVSAAAMAATHVPAASSGCAGIDRRQRVGHQRSGLAGRRRRRCGSTPRSTPRPPDAARRARSLWPDRGCPVPASCARRRARPVPPREVARRLVLGQASARRRATGGRPRRTCRLAGEPVPPTPPTSGRCARPVPTRPRRGATRVDPRRRSATSASASAAWAPRRSAAGAA